MTIPSPATPLRILVIRRDNIGDLVCTTPLINSLRQHFPNARIDALVNSYNLAVISGNTDLNKVYSYTKGKHRGSGQSNAHIYWQRLGMYWQLFSSHYDYVILADTTFSERALSMARWFRPRHIIGFTPGTGNARGLDMPIPPAHANLHVVEQLAQLLQPFKIGGEPPKLQLAPTTTELKQALYQMQDFLDASTGVPLIGLHISARKPSQRWQPEKFIALAHKLHSKHGAHFLLFWSPGEEGNSLHPGDDRKAQAIIEGCRKLPLRAFATNHLAELIAGLSLVDQLICSDGGAMHIAAGLNKPIICFFGKSKVSQWHPWRVPYIALQPASQQVSEIHIDEVIDAYKRLQLACGVITND
jgi:ADP-heptose:LPS heptosyltransferase